MKILMFLLFSLHLAIAAQCQTLFTKKYVFCRVQIANKANYPIIFCGFCQDTDTLDMKLTDTNEFIGSFLKEVYYTPFTFDMLDVDAFAKHFSLAYKTSFREGLDLVINFEKSFCKDFKNMNSYYDFYLQDKAKVSIWLMKTCGVFMLEERKGKMGHNSDGIDPKICKEINFAVYPVCILQNSRVKFSVIKNEENIKMTFLDYQEN